jgi:hypothetical protein
MEMEHKVYFERGLTVSGLSAFISPRGAFPEAVDRMGCMA